MSENNHNTFTSFNYYPVDVLPQLCTAVFGLVSIAATCQIIYFKAQRWLYILSITALAESIGYALRHVSSDDASLGTYTGMNMFLILAPNALVLLNYKTINEVIKLSGVTSRCFCLRSKFIVWFSISNTILAFLTQGGGNIMIANNMVGTGRVVVLVGLTIHIVLLAVCIVITISTSRNNRYVYMMEAKDPLTAKRNVIITICTTTALLCIRSVYRLAEYGDGQNRKVGSTEWAFYTFDTLIVFFCFIVYMSLFIGNNLPTAVQNKTLPLTKKSDTFAPRIDRY